jgi:excisionase family DNA binding protein
VTWEVAPLPYHQRGITPGPTSAHAEYMAAASIPLPTDQDDLIAKALRLVGEVRRLQDIITVVDQLIIDQTILESMLPPKKPVRSVQAIPTPSLDKLFFTRREAAQLLSMSLRTVDSRIAEGKLPVVRDTTGAVRIPRDTIINYGT